MATTRKTAAKKAAAPAEAPVVEKAAEAPVADAPVAAVEAEADRIPLTAPLDAPKGPQIEVEQKNPNEYVGDAGLLAASMLEFEGGERKELYDFATGKAPAIDGVFDLEFVHGQAVICKIRLCENLWAPGATEPISRLVMAAGQRTDRTYADRILRILRDQLGLDQPEAAEQD